MSNRPINRAWHLRSRPNGLIKPEDFAWHEAAVPPLEEGQALVRTIYLSLDPTDRVWASDREQYMTPVPLGEAMRSVALGVVEESRMPGLAAGAYVYGLLGWQDYTVIDRRTPMMTVEPRPGLPLSAYLGFLGFIGITAYIGVIDIL
jgi:NADPH-dependent curcumin reductase CurA